MPEVESIKLGLVDDHILLRKGLRELIETLSKRYQVLFEADNGLDLKQKIDHNNLPNIILMDVNMPGMDGFESVTWLKNQFPQVNVLVVSMIDKEEVVVKMLKLGVKGYLGKDVEPKELNEALITIMQKGFYYTDFITGKLVHSLQSEENLKYNQFDKLNDREKEFLSFACTELTYYEIADKMCLSPKTIDGYRSTLFEKFNVKSRVGLAMYAVKNNWKGISV